LKTERQKLIKKLDDEIRKQVLERDGGRCQYCRNSHSENEVHHIVKRSNFAVRWDLQNLITLCKWECHLWAGTFREAFMAWFEVNFPDRAEHIEEKRKERRRWRDSDLKDLLTRLQAEDTAAMNYDIE
jgi:hypothetical protein